MNESKFVIPVRDLTNRPGQMRELELDIVLDEPLGTVLVTVPKGEKLEIDLRLESVHEGILASGEVSTTAVAECSRCLDSLNLAVEVDFQELFAYSLEEDDDLQVLEEQIDLEQVVTDAVVLSLPFKPVCSEDCLGLCPECGVKMADNPDHAHETKIDSRWSELEKLKEE